MAHDMAEYHDYMARWLKDKDKGAALETVRECIYWREVELRLRAKSGGQASILNASYTTEALLMQVIFLRSLHVKIDAARHDRGVWLCLTE
jgi:hypothetical protein